MARRHVHLMVSVFLGGLVVSAAAGTFRLMPEIADEPEGGRATNQVLVTETHRFAMRFPPGWGVQILATNQTLLMLEPELRAGIELRFWPQEGQAAEELEAWLKRLGERLDDGMILGQFRARSATAEGWGFDLVRAVDETTRAGLRVILVPYPGGMAEFELRAPMTEVTKYYRVLRHLVGSFSPEAREDVERSRSVSRERVR
jgi:hypothetical protein